ncbi:hypothetical protein MKX01_032631 [Papaver californicum]|nr:hypothetical protein MKX01_032631 [Papaver californicum]
MALKALLPPARSTTSTVHDHFNYPWLQQRYFSNPEPDHAAAVVAHAKAKIIPPYQNRQGIVSRNHKDYGNGGAFPEIHVTQYLKLDGQEKLVGSTKILPLTVDAHANVAYDIDHLVPKVLKAGAGDESGESDEELQKESEEEKRRSTKDAIEKKLGAAQPSNIVASSQSSDTKFIKCRPSRQWEAFNSGSKEWMIISPRHLIVKDYQDCKVPLCVSNWKNPKGYTIPLDKRLAADGRGLQEVQINENHAKFAEPLYVIEDIAREVVAVRSKVHKQTLLMENERKEQELRASTQKARSERTCGVPMPSTSDRIMSDAGDEDMRDASMGKKSKITRDRDRDVSEKVALGMANTGVGGRGGGEIMYDQRLFNQDKGMDSGFSTDDQYNVYDKREVLSHSPLLSQNTISILYKPRKNTDTEMYGGGADKQQLDEKVMKTDRFNPDKGFTGVPEREGPRDKPFEFDKAFGGDDPFGLDKFLEEVQGGGKKGLDKVESGGEMRASGGGCSRDNYDGSRSSRRRTRIGFERGGARVYALLLFHDCISFLVVCL